MALAKGDAANVSRLRLGAHTGAHVGAPAHCVAGGRRERAIGPEHVTEAMVAGAERVLFKTRNSSFWAEERFREDFTFITPEAARALVAARVRLVGIDYLSVEVFKSANHDTHKVLLADNVIVLEGLDLSGIVPGVYELLCLPLKLDGGAGDPAPARAVLRRYDSIQSSLRQQGIDAWQR